MVEIVTEKHLHDDSGNNYVFSSAIEDSPVELSENSSNSDEVTSGAMTISIKEEPKKRRGGWPKGKRRKNPPNIILPKAPATGYLLYINEKRKELKQRRPDVPFSEATRILGNEWSSMPSLEKQVYLDKAEADKKRYAAELKEYKEKIEKEKNEKESIVKTMSKEGIAETHKTQISDPPDTNLGILFCEVCDQYFVNDHNKQEHLYGKQHLINVMGRVKKKTSELYDVYSTTRIESKSVEVATNSIQLSEYRHATEKQSKDLHFGSMDLKNSVPRAMEMVISTNIERETELTRLKNTNQYLKDNHKSLLKELESLERSCQNASLRLDGLKTIGDSYTNQLVNLRMVPTLFGVIKF